MKKERPDDKHDTSTEVGTLVESFRNDISVIAEEVRGLSDWRGEVTIRLDNIENRLVLCEDAIRISIPDIYRQLTLVKVKIGI